MSALMHMPFICLPTPASFAYSQAPSVSTLHAVMHHDFYCFLSSLDLLCLDEITAATHRHAFQCLLQVDDFELAEETPVKAAPRLRTPVTASPDAAEPQARRLKPPASAEWRTAEWLTGLSPVIEHDEHSPVGQLDTRVADASLGETGVRSRLTAVSLDAIPRFDHVATPAHIHCVSRHATSGVTSSVAIRSLRNSCKSLPVFSRCLMRLQAARLHRHDNLHMHLLANLLVPTTTSHNNGTLSITVILFGLHSDITCCGSK